MVARRLIDASRLKQLPLHLVVHEEGLRELLTSDAFWPIQIGDSMRRRGVREPLRVDRSRKLALVRHRRPIVEGGWAELADGALEGAEDLSVSELRLVQLRRLYVTPGLREVFVMPVLVLVGGRGHLLVRDCVELILGVAGLLPAEVRAASLLRGGLDSRQQLR